MINKEYNLWCEKLTNIYRNSKIVVTMYSYNILILKDNFMKKGVMKKLNMFLCKYAFAPISIVLLVISLTSCGTDKGKEHLSTLIYDDTSTEETTINQNGSESSEEPTVTTAEQTTEETTTPAQTTTPAPTTTPEPTTTPAPTTTPVPTTKQQTTKVEETTAKPKDYVINLEMPSANGTVVSDLNGYIIDYGNINSGYVMIKATVNADSVVQVRLGDSKGTLVGQYVLKISNNYVAIPLTKGNVTYCVRVMQKNPSTGKYAEKNAITVTPSISNERQPYKIPNVYVYYMKSSTAVNLSYQICDGLTNDADKVKAIYNYIVKNIKYDYAFAQTATAGYMDSERCLRNKSGICGDYSVLFATMCRAQGIPCIVIEGYVTVDGDVYHAWNQVHYNGEWHFYDTTFDASGGKGKNYLESFRY